jgi:hypothetical protein
MKLLWNIYEIESNADTLHGVMFRGRIRKFTIENNIICLAENASDKENTVRFALLKGDDPSITIEFIKKLMPGVAINLALESVENPVLSKLKVNDISRYSLE